jgi:hypothetical protein
MEDENSVPMSCCSAFSFLSQDERKFVSLRTEPGVRALGPVQCSQLCHPGQLPKDTLRDEEDET